MLKKMSYTHYYHSNLEIKSSIFYLIYLDYFIVSVLKVVSLDWLCLLHGFKFHSIYNFIIFKREMFLGSNNLSEI